MTTPLNNQCYELFGDGWEYEVARRLGVQARSVRRWASGESSPPEELEQFIRFWQKGSTK